MASALIAIAVIVFIIVLVFVVWLVMDYLLDKQTHITFGETTNATTSAPLPGIVTPTPVPTPTPTTPAPNWQFLPQKAYVIPFAPENGVPQSAIPLQSVTPVVQQQAAQPASSGFDINSIIPIVIAAGSGLLAKMGLDKAKKVEGTSKENANAIVDTKVVQQEIARYMFNLDKAKAEALNDAPAIKLESLEQEKKKATETATKA